MPTPAPLPRLVTSCQRGTEEFRPILYLPYSPAAKSTLELALAPGVTCDLLLAPRYTKFLLLAAEAWSQDEGDIETHRGYRTNAEIGERLSNPSNDEPVTEQTVRAYVREIRAEIKKAVRLLRLQHRRDLRIPVLIENGRMQGYRIGASGLEIVQSRRRAVITT